MGDSKLYSAQEIEKLKQKINIYKETLSTLKTGNSVDDYLLMKNEFYDFKKQVTNLEGVMEIMEEKQNMQIEEYEQQVNKISAQIDSLNQTVEELNQDVSALMNRLSNSDINELIERINIMIDLQDSLSMANENAESKIRQTDQKSISPVQNLNPTPSYKQLQKFINNSEIVHETSNDVTTTDNSIQKNGQKEQQQNSKKSFPSNGINPEQLTNNLNKNINAKSTNNINKKAMNQAVPKANKDSANSAVPNNIQSNKDQTLTSSSNKVDMEASNEKKKDAVDIPNENKENEKTDILSFFNFFRKKD
ncbi:hypothetical protein LG329_03380 [Virgibacillus necropolis]|uniref:hypothetical protein n=1 Tax=Virgibacillus necropolis TaxID=163877 RepID=UPI00384C9DC6